VAVRWSRVRERLSDPAGSTLAETLVAMSLFVSVLIPLLAAIGNLVFDNRTERLQESLHLAQSEIAVAEASGATVEDHAQSVHGLAVERRVAIQGGLAHVHIMVRDTRKRNRLLLELSKTITYRTAASPG
jgi:hypothetical protein